MAHQDPAYRKFARKGRTPLGFVQLEGRRIYLGTWDSPESRQRYHRILAEWNACGRHEQAEQHDITVLEVIERFWQHAKEYYRYADGTPTGEADAFKCALKPLKELYGCETAASFGPRGLKALRNELIKAGGSRRTINEKVRKIKQVFKWAVAEELVPPDVYEALHAVSGLKAGRSEAYETEPVRPVMRAHIDAVKPLVSRQVWALIELQLLTAARSGELVKLRAADLDTTGRIWVYTPEHHKTAHHGHKRAIYFGPRAQEVLKPFLADRSPWAPLFSPREAEAERLERRHAERKVPLSCGHRPGNHRTAKPKREAKEQFTVHSYGRAIRRACEELGIPPWHPHQLRHYVSFLTMSGGIR